MSLLSIFSSLSCDTAYPWQIGFQDGSTPTFEGIVELHDTIFFYLVVISFLVFWMLAAIIVKFSSSKVGIVHKYTNHGTLIELIWTITPALILIAIAFPSFKLLYLMDSPIGIGLDLDTLFHLAVAVGTASKNSSVDIPKIPKTPVKNLRSSSTDLVIVGSSYSTGSTIGINYNDRVRAIAPFPSRVVSQFVGHLLGDGSLTMSWSSVMPAFMFTQTLKRFEYI